MCHFSYYFLCQIFRWKEEICLFIDKNWSILLPGKSKPPTWIGTVAGTLSVNSPRTFKSGQVYFNESGWWALQEVTIPKSDPEAYKITKQQKKTADMLKNKTDNSANITSDLGRGKRQRKTKEKLPDVPPSKALKTESTKKIISPAECVKVANIKKEPVDSSCNNVVTDKVKIVKQKTSQQCARTSLSNKEIKKEKKTHEQQQQVTKNPISSKMDFKVLNSNCNIMAELQDAGYSNAVQVEDPFASLFDDISIFEMPASLNGDQINNVVKKESTSSAAAINVEKPVPLSQSTSSMKGSNSVKQPSDKLPKVGKNLSTDIPGALFKPIENLNAIKPIQKVNNVKPLSISEESEFLAKLNCYPLTVDSDCSVRRLRRKLLTRKARREKGLPHFSITKKKNINEKSKIPSESSTEQVQSENQTTTNKESEKPSFNHPALVGVNVLDKFHNFLHGGSIQSKLSKTPRLLTLIGVDNSSGGYQNTITSPYTSRVLKPYIRRDFDVLPPKLRILRDIQKRCSIKSNYNWPVDYCYVQPMHIPAVNALCNDFFWPGIDLTECLQYPEFSCVVMYRKLLIGFAFMVPDVKFNEAYISFILVHPDWQRCGIATSMIYHLIQTCMGKDITLHVSPSNPSMLLYQKFGFKAEALILDFYKKYLPEEDTSSKHAFLLRLQR